MKTGIAALILLTASVMAVLSVTPAATAPTGRTAAAPPDLRTARLIDLSHPFDEKTLYWPTSPTSFAMTRLARGTTPGGYFYSANSFCTPEHGGTHLDAPVHFAEKGKTADQIPLRQLLAPAVVIDVRDAAARDADYRARVSDLEAWERRHGAIPAGSIVLLRTGWSSRWPDRKRYFGDDTPGDASHLHFPSYGAEAAGQLVRNRRVAALGVDTASIDYGPSNDFPVHRVAAASDVPGLENLTGLDQLPESGAWVIALPMKIAGGSGGPLRAVALVP
jgi:kynurenine formamidase